MGLLSQMTVVRGVSEWQSHTFTDAFAEPLACSVVSANDVMVIRVWRDGSTFTSFETRISPRQTSAE